LSALPARSRDCAGVAKHAETLAFASSATGQLGRHTRTLTCSGGCRGAMVIAIMNRSSGTSVRRMTKTDNPIGHPTRTGTVGPLVLGVGVDGDYIANSTVALFWSLSERIRIRRLLFKK
jgi:hypothetical protein